MQHPQANLLELWLKDPNCLVLVAHVHMFLQQNVFLIPHLLKKTRYSNELGEPRSSVEKAILIPLLLDK